MIVDVVGECCVMGVGTGGGSGGDGDGEGWASMGDGSVSGALAPYRAASRSAAVANLTLRRSPVSVAVFWPMSWSVLPLLLVPFLGVGMRDFPPFGGMLFLFSE